LLLGDTADVDQPWNDGDPSEATLQRSPPLLTPLATPAQGVARSAEASNPTHLIQVPSQRTFLSFRTSNPLFTNVSLGVDLGGLDTIAARQVTREDLPTAKARAPSSKTIQRRKPVAFVRAPPIPTLVTPPSNGLGTISPSGGDIQGPSPIDYGLKLKVEFPPEILLEMQESTIQKARRTVIGRTLGGRTTIKTLHNCLKLHLPTTFVSTTLLTQDYFEVLFANEEGAKAVRIIIAIEWNGLNLFFSRYVSNFDSNVQGAEALLSHSIKVQFPDLHEQFRNTKALTIIANKIGEVFKIKMVDSYMKRPACCNPTLREL